MIEPTPTGVIDLLAHHDCVLLDVYRVRGVSGVEWAVPLFKGLPRAKAFDGNFRVTIMMGVDDATLVGAPRNMVLGSPENLRQPDAVLVDRVGYEFFFPQQPYVLGKTLELNDHRVTIQGIFNSSAPFQNSGGPGSKTGGSSGPTLDPPVNRGSTASISTV